LTRKPVFKAKQKEVLAKTYRSNKMKFTMISLIFAMIYFQMSEAAKEKFEWGTEGEITGNLAMTTFYDKTELAAFFELNKAKMTGERVFQLGYLADPATATPADAATNFKITNQAEYKDASAIEITTSDNFATFAKAVAKEAAKDNVSNTDATKKSDSKLTWAVLKPIIGDDFEIDRPDSSFGKISTVTAIIFSAIVLFN
jgi:hypothetical protein